jgi:hypothetical protein
MLSKTACAICLAVWATGARGADTGATWLDPETPAAWNAPDGAQPPAGQLR